MKKQISHVSPFQSAKVMAVLYFVISLPFALLMLALPTPAGAYPGWMVFVLPIAYLVFGFLFSLIGAWVYNLVARMVGGFEFTTVEVAGSNPAA